MQGKSIIKILLILSLIINSVFIYLIKFSTTEIADTKTLESNDKISDIYDMSDFQSTSYPNQKLDARFNRLYDQYLKDKEIDTDTFYTDKVVDPAWNRQCISNIKRIMVISGDLEIIETTLTNVMDQSNAQDAKKNFDSLIEAKGYHEKLLDMSNFYARFVSEDIYNRTQQSID